MTSARSLYRRHRPRTFADVVGQAHIVQTLTNAVEQDRLHHAYLFVGSRGTGKTSMAKILAACLNCAHGRTTTPCGQCESCRSIAEACSLDVIEMDAASNNSVDDIRELRDKVAFAPVIGQHKVYILDEVHMLSTQAWNAFLKTLEEPPPHTIFVLATTEAQKVLPTVVDRCHRFDFRRPSVQQIAAVLSRVATTEGIDLPEAACALIARAATGSFRDALGTLEQLVTYTGMQVRVEDVAALLGIADGELLFATGDALAQRDAAAALRLVQQLAESGRDFSQFFADLEAHARALLCVQTLQEVPSELALTDAYDAHLQAQAGALQPMDVVRLLDLVARALESIKAGADARTQLEVCLLRAARPDFDPDQQRAQATPPARATSLPAPARAATTPLSKPPAVAQKSFVEPAKPVGAIESLPESSAAPPAPSAPVAVTGVVATTPDLDALRRLWPAVIEAVQTDNAMLGAVLAGTRPTALVRDALTVAFPPSAGFLKRKADDVKHRQAVTDVLAKLTGDALKLSYELSEAVSDIQSEQPKTSDQWVERLVQEFDAEEIISETTRE